METDPIQNEHEKEQQSIFSDVVDTTRYQKSLKTARIYLYIVAGIQLAVGAFEYFSSSDQELGLIAFGIDAGLGLIFFLLALWSRKKPTPAFITALILYVVIHIGLMILEPSNIYRGIILKILVVVALIKACNDAREAEKLKNAIGS